MLNTAKSHDFFAPERALEGETAHIIGCGAVGGFLGTILARVGVTKIDLWDGDIVEGKNINNQTYFDEDIGFPKTAALEKQIHRINDTAQITQHGWYTGQHLSGYVFLCIDNIDKRREFVEQWIYNPDIIFVQDFRMRLTGGQIYAANWSDETDKNNLLETMQFTHEEAQTETPRSACGEEMSVVCAPIAIANAGVATLIRFLNVGTYYLIQEVDPYNLVIFKAGLKNK